MYKIKFDKISSINFFSLAACLLPAALVSGPFLSDLIVSVIALFFIYQSVKEKLWSYYDTFYVKFFFVFYFYLLFGSIFSVAPENSLESSLFYFRFLFFTLGFLYLMDKNPKIINYFSYTLFITIFFVILDAYLQFFSGSNIVGYPIWNAGDRISGFLKDESLGRYLTYILPLMFSLIFLKKSFKKLEIIFILLIIPNVYIVIFLTGERTSFFLAILGLVMLVFCLRRLRYLMIIGILFSVIVLSAITLNSPQLKNRMIDSSFSSIKFDNGEIKLISDHYEGIFKTSFQIFLDNPIIGVGVKNFRIVCSDEEYSSKYSCSTHPHNSMLQFLSETGIIGSTFYFFLLFYCLKRIIFNFYYRYYSMQNNILDDYQICLYVGFIVVLWPFAPSLNFFNNWISILYFLPLPFLLQTKSKLVF